MALADGFRASEYLIDYYIQSSQALWAFEHDDNADALRKAAEIICDALTRVSIDRIFWNALAEVKGPIDNSQHAIREALDDIDLFLSQEAQILGQFKFPDSVLKRSCSISARRCKHLKPTRLLKSSIS